LINRFGVNAVLHRSTVVLINFRQDVDFDPKSVDLTEVPQFSTSIATAVTANLSVDCRFPFKENTEAMIRVYIKESKGQKIYFYAKLESMHGSILYAEANSLFILVKSI
jgi:hypothetical protein